MSQTTTRSSTSQLFDGLSRLSSQQRLLRLVVLLVPLLAVVVEVWAGATVQVWYAIVVGVLALGSALLPDSHIGLLVVVTVGGHWATSSAGVLGYGVLVLAVALLVFHVSALLASYGPPSVVLEADLVLAWLGRAALATAVAAIVWVVARVAGGLGLPDHPLVFGGALLVLVAATLLATGLMTGMLSWSAGRPDAPGPGEAPPG